MQCVYPASMGEALRHLAETPDSVLIAGCTDFFPAQGTRPITRPIIDLTGIAEARAIAAGPAELRIGALATWSEIADAALPPAFRGLQQAARQIGAIQVQNAGTIGGNLCNASPAADGVPPLLTLGARVELASLAGIRVLPLDQFILGNRKTARRPDEIVSAVLVTPPARPAVAAFRKLGSRSTLVISIAMVAVLLEVDTGNRIAAAAIAVGACSVVARRLPELEAALVGHPLAPDQAPHLAELVTAAHLAGLSPIDDIRASAAYRRDAARTLVQRALVDAAGGVAP